MKNELKSSTTTTATKAERSNTQVFKFVSFVCTYQLLTFSPNGKIRKTKTRQILVLVKKKKVFKTLSDPFSVKLRQKF
jgi:hypothetical protein